MIRSNLRGCAATALSLLISCTSQAASSTGAMHAKPRAVPVADPDGVTLHDAWARASAGAAATAAAYVTLMGGSKPDQLVGASAPVAETAEVHQTLTENGVMKMRPVPSLPIPAGQMVTFAPNGVHIMLMGLKHPLVAGQSFPLTLTFAHSAPVSVEVTVRALGARTNDAVVGHDGMQMR